MIGRYPGDIGDLTRLAAYSGYWRGGPVTNNAISGIDQALWDIAGKRAGMPVYELLGGKVRAVADTYVHAGGISIEDTIEQAEELVAQGWRHVRLQVSTPGGGGYGDLDLEAAAAYPARLSGHDEWAAGVRRLDGALEAP